MVKIRNLEKEDAGQVATLIPQLTNNIVDPENLINRIERLAEAMHTDMMGYQFLVVQIDSVIVGFGGLVWYTIPSKGLTGYLEEIVVDQNYRRHGVGMLLVDHLLDAADKLGLKQEKLTTGNSVAHHLYEKLGFHYKQEELMVRKP